MPDDKLLQRPDTAQNGAIIVVMRRAVLLVLVVAGLFALASAHLSKGEPLPLPPDVVVVHGDVK